MKTINQTLILLIALLFLPLTVGASKTPTVDSPQSVYVKTGYNDVYKHHKVGSLHFDSSQKKWVLKVKIGIYGLNNFLNISSGEIESLIDYENQKKDFLLEKYGVTLGTLPKKEDFLSAPNPASLADIKVAEVISNQIKKAEQLYNTEYLETEINFFFIDESQNPMPEEWAPTMSSSGKVESDFLPISYVPKGFNDALKLAVWTPWVTYNGIAHELYHWLSQDQFNDGYKYGNYPLDSFMNSEFEFVELAKLQKETRLYPFEFNTLIKKQMDIEVSGTTSSLIADWDDPERDTPKYFNSKDFRLDDPASLQKKVEIFQQQRFPGKDILPYMPLGQ